MDIQSIGSQQPMSGAPEFARQAGVEPTQSGASVSVPVQAVQPAGATNAHEQLKNAVENLNSVVQNMPHSTNLEFSIDESTKINVVKVVDKSTKEVVRQIPSEEVLVIAKAIDRLQGLILREKA